MFARNLENGEQAQKLCSELQTLKKQISSQPLLIGLDHEGGFVTRAKHIIPGFPPAMAQAMAGKPEDTKSFFFRASLAMRAVGINCNFAPVLDILPKDKSSSIGIRSFGSDKKTVSEFAVAAFKGMEEAGILACGKHFPGLGSARLDSHDTLPTVSKLKFELLREDLIPFQDLIHLEIPLLMTAHAFYPALEKETIPATFSRQINEDLLRKKFNFKGVLISDDLGMGAITERASLEEAILCALSNGVDLALVCHEEEGLLHLFEHLENTFFDRIPESHLLASAERKRALCRHLEKLHSDPILKNVEVDFVNLRKSIAKNSFQILQVNSKPCQEDSIIVLALPGWIPKGVEETPASLNNFFNAFHARFKNSELRVLKNSNDMHQFAKKESKKNILLLAKDLALDPIQCAFVEKFSRHLKEIRWAICVKNLEDAHFLKPFVDTIVCTLGFEEDNWQTILEFFAAREIK